MNKTEQAAAIIKEWMETFIMRSMEYMHRHVRTTGVSMPQFSLMMRLYHGGGLAMHDVSRHFDVSGAAASQLVDKLVVAGFATRSENPDDRRAREITLTEGGSQFIRKSLDERSAWVADMVNALSSEECDAILASLPILIAAEKRLPTRDARHGVPLQ